MRIKNRNQKTKTAKFLPHISNTHHQRNGMKNEIISVMILSVGESPERDILVLTFAFTRESSNGTNSKYLTGYGLDRGSSWRLPRQVTAWATAGRVGDCLGIVDHDSGIKIEFICINISRCFLFQQKHIILSSLSLSVVA
jgi:hypothetical protein